MDKLMKMMAGKKEGKKPLAPEYKEAKGGILKDLISEMSGMIGGDLKGLKKVTVAAPDAEGLKEGLEKAESMVPEGEEDSEEDAEMCAECASGEHDASSHDHAHEDSPEALKAKIAELEAKLAAKGE